MAHPALPRVVAPQPRVRRRAPGALREHPGPPARVALGVDGERPEHAAPERRRLDGAGREVARALGGAEGRAEVELAEGREVRAGVGRAEA